MYSCPHTLSHEVPMAGDYPVSSAAESSQSENLSGQMGTQTEEVGNVLTRCMKEINISYHLTLTFEVALQRIFPEACWEKPHIGDITDGEYRKKGDYSTRRSRGQLLLSLRDGFRGWVEEDREDTRGLGRISSNGIEDEDQSISFHKLAMDLGRGFATQKEEFDDRKNARAVAPNKICADSEASDGGLSEALDSGLCGGDTDRATMATERASKKKAKFSCQVEVKYFRHEFYLQERGYTVLTGETTVEPLAEEGEQQERSYKNRSTAPYDAFYPKNFDPWYDPS
ncbi:hypothetical protein AAG570_013840 [Ranatra chinensis]|uniref:Uncharacterized protein n=1 Tax=Ranatra chinensis TaxID=642074 RepID=A0ABD0YDB9_9HEMI